MSAELAGKPRSTQNYALSQNTGLVGGRPGRLSNMGHIVCSNPVDGSEMYCLPVTVVAFGNFFRKPDFCIDEQPAGRSIM